MKLYRGFLFTLPVALVVLLVGLGALQYRWVEESSENERRRMAATLRLSLDAMARQFDDEIARGLSAVQIEAEALVASDGAAATDSWRRWASTSEVPGLIAGVRVVTIVANELELRRLDLETGQLVPIEWEGADLRLREQIEDDLRSRRNTQRRWVVDDPLAVVTRITQLPRITTAGAADVASLLRQIQEVRRPGLRGYVITHLDADVIRERLMPLLVTRYLPDGEFRVSLIRAVDGAPLFISGGEPIDDPDATAGVLTDTVAPLVIPANAQGRSGEIPVRVFSDSEPLPQQLTITPSGELPPHWVLRVAHRTGSVDAAVAGLQRRNLLLGFSILIVLAIGIAVAFTHARRADALARQQMEFVSVMSHELRTPIAIVNAAADNLSRGLVADRERGREYGQAIKRESRRLEAMVDQVLEFARRPDGDSWLLTDVDLAAVAGDVVDALQGVAAEAGGTIDLRSGTDLPVVVGDAEALGRAMRNLVINAIRHSGDRPAVTVEVACVERQALVRVSDRGPGISTEERAQLTQPFFRGARAIERQVPGSGLGLAIVRRIVEAHGGRLQIESREGGGSTFTLWLRRKRG